MHGDALWPLQLDVCRAVLAAGGIPPDELAEWLAVARRGTEPDTEAGADDERAARAERDADT